MKVRCDLAAGPKLLSASQNPTQEPESEKFEGPEHSAIRSRTVVALLLLLLL